MRDDRTFLLHIRDAVQNIAEDMADGEAVFHRDRRRRDAVVRNLEIIGEAARNLSDELRAAHPTVPWS